MVNPIQSLMLAVFMLCSTQLFAEEGGNKAADPKVQSSSAPAPAASEDSSKTPSDQTASENPEGAENPQDPTATPDTPPTTATTDKGKDGKKGGDSTKNTVANKDNKGADKSDKSQGGSSKSDSLSDTPSANNSSSESNVNTKSMTSDVIVKNYENEYAACNGNTQCQSEARDHANELGSGNGLNNDDLAELDQELDDRVSPH